MGKLGFRHNKCRICGEEGDFQSYLVREMFKGTRDEFEYFVCPKCQCLQIAAVPENLGYYYGNDYYSMKINLDPNVVFDTPVTDSSKILDVGCGAGEWLYERALSGCNNLFGCDPFVEHDIIYGDRVYIRKCDITEMDGDGTFDSIRMNDSFEHVTNPKEVLKKARDLIKDDGVIAMQIPTYPNIAFDMFETHWFQLDAPRHIFLHSRLSINYLAKECGLRINSLEYNSNNSQIIRSFFYQHGVSFDEQNEELIRRYFSSSDLKRIDEMSEEANKNQVGDHMKVWLKKL